MTTPRQGVEWNARRRRHLIVVVLDPDEADNIGHALGSTDAGADQLHAWADEARALDEDRAR